MIRSVVKHSYVRGAKAVAKAKAHVGYIEGRPGKDRDERTREFFNAERADIGGREIKERIDDQDDRWVTMHKIILSPGFQELDLKDYARRSMEQLGYEKGLTLDWYGVVHKNTDHDHVHVVVMGLDREGNRVKFDRADHVRLRESGDQFLDRERQLERYLDRAEHEYLRDPKYRTREEKELDREFNRLEYGEHGGRKRTAREIEQDRRDWEKFDRDIHKSFERQDRGLERPLTYDRYQRESAGRLSEFHEHAQHHEATKRWREIAERNPEVAKEAERELAWLENMNRESRADRLRETDLDKLLTGKEEIDRNLDKILDKEQRQLDRELERLREQQPDRSDRTNAPDILRLLYGQQFKDRDRGEDESYRSFESDRHGKEERQDREEDERDRDRSDDLDRGR